MLKLRCYVLTLLVIAPASNLVSDSRHLLLIILDFVQESFNNLHLSGKLKWVWMVEPTTSSHPIRWCHSLLLGVVIVIRPEK